MKKYKTEEFINEGTFAWVYKGTDTRTGQKVALKCLKHLFQSKEEALKLNELEVLRLLNPHPNIIKLYEVLYDEVTGRLALVIELMDMNCLELYEKRKFPVPEIRVRNYMYQLLKALDHMQANNIFHRDIKPENLLVKEESLKLADFGCCKGIYATQPYTEYISTRWYRPPEVLLTDGFYDSKMDIWGVGCVLFELLTSDPLFPGRNEVDQIGLIHKILGTPSLELLKLFQVNSVHMDFNFSHKKGSGIESRVTQKHPSVSASCVDLLGKMLAYDPRFRISPKEALGHPWFADLRKREVVVVRPYVVGMEALSRSSSPHNTYTNYVSASESIISKLNMEEETSGTDRPEGLSQSPKSRKINNQKLSTLFRTKYHKSIIEPPILEEQKSLEDLRQQHDSSGMSNNEEQGLPSIARGRHKLFMPQKKNDRKQQSLGAKQNMFKTGGMMLFSKGTHNNPHHRKEVIIFTYT